MPPWQPDFYQRSQAFAPVAPLAATLGNFQNWPGLEAFQELMELVPPIITGDDQPIRFVAPEKGTLQDMHGRYEPRIYLRGEIQTRPDNWHDFFNVLVWLTFPATKAALNSRHYSEMEHREMGVSRGGVRDALTVFDESGVIVLSSNPELLELMRRFRWKELFWLRRNEVMTDMKFLVFGHALYEKFLDPYIGMTGMSLLFEVSGELLKEPLAHQLKEADALATSHILRKEAMGSAKELWPLPLLGIPGWWAENGQEMFYDNERYFRPRRHAGSDKSSSSNESLT